MKYQTQTENINPQESMIGENRQLVTDAPVEVEKLNNLLKLKTAGKLPTILEEFIENTQSGKGKPEL